MVEKSLWGDLESLPPSQTPRLILKQQATFLRDFSNGILEPEISDIKSSRSDIRAADFIIKVPTLNNYRLALMRIRGGSAPYPISIQSTFSDGDINCSTEEEFVSELEVILSSEAVGKAIKALIAEAAYDEN